MRLLERLFEPRPKSQAHIVRRAAAVIDHVIFDVGVDTLVGGTFLLDKRFRLRFVSVPPPRARGVVARVQVSQMAEAGRFSAVETLDSDALKAHSASLALALVRELGAQSAALRALPA
jgi:hypothetical protein